MAPVLRSSKRKSKLVQREYRIATDPSSRYISFEIEFEEKDSAFYVFRVPFLDTKIDTLEEMFEQEQPTNFPPISPDEFKWESHSNLQMLHSMFKKKPTGPYRFKRIIYMRYELNLRLKMNIPVEVLWDFLNKHWDLEAANQIEYEERENEYNDFELPNTEEWNSIEVRKLKASAPLIRIGVSKLPVARVLLKRIDDKLNKKQMKKLLKLKAENAKTTLAGRKKRAKIASTSSNVKIGGKRKRGKKKKLINNKIKTMKK